MLLILIETIKNIKNMRVKNPCKNCICLPKCVILYKELSNRKIWFPLVTLKNNCELLYDAYMKLDVDYDSVNHIDRWWGKNYGRNKM